MESRRMVVGNRVLMGALVAAMTMGCGVASTRAAVLAWDNFNSVDLSSASTVPLNGVSSGAGFSGAWGVQNANTTIPGYNVTNSSPLSAGAGAYATGGNAYLGSGRGLDNSVGGVFDLAGQRNSDGTLGTPGSTLIFSALMRKDLNNGNGFYLGLGTYPYNTSPPDRIEIGYNGNNTSGTRYYALGSSPTTSGPVTWVNSTAPITVGVADLLVTRIAYDAVGTGATLSLYVNPTDPSNPTGTPAATLVVTNATFNHLDFASSDTGNAGQASVDNIAISTLPVPEPASLGLLAIGGLALLRRRH